MPKNYQNTVRFDKVIAEVEGCNVFASLQCIIIIKYMYIAQDCDWLFKLGTYS